MLFNLCTAAVHVDKCQVLWEALHAIPFIDCFALRALERKLFIRFYLLMIPPSQGACTVSIRLLRQFRNALLANSVAACDEDAGRVFL